MKLSTVKSTLDYAKNFLATQDFIEILQYFAFNEDTVTAYNDVCACQLKLDTGLQCTVPGTLLLRLLNTLSSEELEIEKQPKNVQVISGRSKTKLPTLPLEDYIFQIPDTDEDAVIVPNTAIEGFRKCLTNVSTNPTQPQFSGINLIVENKKLTLYSSDGLTISRFEIDDTFNVAATDQIQCILPAFFCERLVSLHTPLAGKEYNVPLQFSKNWAMADLNDNKLFTRVINKTPPKYADMVMRSVPNLASLELFDIPDELESIIDRATIFLNPQANVEQSSFTVSGNEMEVTTKSTLGHSHDRLQLPKDLGQFSFTLNPNLLLRGFKVCKRMTLMPNVIVMDYDNYLHLIATN